MTIDRETVIRLAREANSYACKKAIGAWDYGSIRDMYFAALVLEHGRKPLCWLQQDKFGNFHVADESWHGAFPVYGDQSEKNKEQKK